MTKEEFTNIVKQFNIDKVQYNWNEALSFKKKLVWKNFKAKLINFPTYYEFKEANEFKYWLLNSEKPEFIEERFCPICGNFIEKTPGVQFKFYNGGCCKEHSKIVRINKIQKSNLEKYGCISPMQRKEVADKVKATNLLKYGTEFPLQNKKIHLKSINNRSEEEKKESAKKVKATKLEKYGNENYNNAKSISETKLNWTEEQKENYLNKVQNTKLERYDDENYNNREQAKQTCIKKYGVDNPSKDDIIIAKAAERSIQARINNHTLPSDLFKNKEFKNNYVAKVYATKKQNGTLNTSHNFEDKMITYLKETYPQYTILTQYKDERYPFACDCYIKELDLFIEFQGSFFHNFRQFNNSEEHIKEYNELIAKGGLAANIANVWRYKDVEKRNKAKENNLNYLEYWELLKLLPEDTKQNQQNLVSYFQQDLFYEPNKAELFDPIKRWEYYKNAVKYNDFYKEYSYVNHLALLRRPYISKQIGYSSFNIALCKIIDKDNIIYDPCGGWGHRLLGFQKAKQYIYNDINTATMLNCKKMAKELQINNCIFYNQDARLPIKEEYNVVFTCPPYYNKELYSKNGAENYTEEEFITWWNEVLNNLHPTSGEIYIVINSTYLKYFTSNNYNYEIIQKTMRKSHFHKNTKIAGEIIVKYIK